MTVFRDDRTCETPDLTAFVTCVRAAGITRVVLRRTEEHRPIEGTSQVPVDKMRRCELLGYLESVLYRCVLDGADARDVARQLMAHGLTVHLTSGNIT